MVYLLPLLLKGIYFKKLIDHQVHPIRPAFQTDVYKLWFEKWHYIIRLPSFVHRSQSNLRNNKSLGKAESVVREGFFKEDFHGATSHIVRSL